MAFRISLALLLFAVAAVTAIGYFSFRRRELEREKTVFLCKSCGNAWTELDRSVKVSSELPKFKILLSCPSCDKRLLDLETGVVQGDELEARESVKRQGIDHT
jgi:Zn finger protein HypA/HybF involved in hydrogenase expression